MKLTKIIAVVLLVGILFAGCDVSQLLESTEKEFTQGDVTLKLPATFMNYSGTDSAEGKDFLFASSNIGVTGVKEDKKELFDFFGETDLNGYAELIAELYELNVTPTQKDGHPTFTYQQEVGGVTYTYTSVFYETASAYWNVQVYCKSAEYEENADTMWRYATSATFADSGEIVDKTEDTTLDTSEEVTEDTTVEVTTEAPQQQIPSGDVTLKVDLPSDFLNYTGTDLADEYAFLYVNDEIGVLGVQENKEELFAYFDETDLEGYANLIAELYELDTVPTQKDGIWTLTYSDASSGNSFTYVSAFYETEADFWNVQAYCMTKDYDKYSDDLWNYITNIEFIEN